MQGRLPSLDEFREAAKTRFVRECASPDGKYLGYKYTEDTTFDCHWDIVTLNARGIAFDATTGKCVLRPYKKFFNYSELVAGTQTTALWDILKETDGFYPEFSKKFRYLDKLDGSLYIASVLDDGTFLGKTSGSFTAWQGQWAERWVKEHIDVSYLGDGTAKSGTMKCNCTFLFEIICDDDLHPISYDYESCVLHGIVDNATGEELPLSDMQKFAEHWNLKIPEITHFDTLEEAIEYTSALPSSKEGGVITFENGFKVKVKGKEFLALQKLYHNLTPRYIWENLNPMSGDFNHGVIELIPEEMPEIKAYALELRDNFAKQLDRVVKYAADIAKSDLPRKDIYKKVASEFSDKALIGAVMGMYTTITKTGNAEPFKEVRDAVKKFLTPKRDVSE